MARYIIHRQFPDGRDPELLGIIEAPTQPAAKAAAVKRWGVDPSCLFCSSWSNASKRLQEKVLKKEEEQS